MPVTDSNSNKPTILKTTREAKGMTLEMVHEATKIPMDALRAIEEGYSVRILSPFYYRGFIKIYAEFLGLDVGEMYKEYGLDQTPKLMTSVPPPAPVRPSKEPAGPNLFLEQVQEWIALVFKPKNIKLALKVIGCLVLLFLLFKMAGCAASHIHKKAATRKQAIFIAPEKKAVVYKDVEEDKPAPVVVPQEAKHEVVPVPSDNHKVEVAVRATRNTWIQVKADDKVVFQMTLNKGSMETWTADNRIELSGRNIEQLDMEINGKHVGSLAGGERRIRKVLITQEGLTVKK